MLGDPMRRCTPALGLAVILAAACSSESKDPPPGTTDGALASDGFVADAAAGCQDTPRKVLTSLTYKPLASNEEPMGWSTALAGSSVGLVYVDALNDKSCLVHFVVLGLDGKTLGRLKFNALTQHYNWNSHNYVSVASSPSGFGLAWDSWRVENQLDKDTYYTDVYTAFTDAKGAMIRPPTRENSTVIQYTPRYEVRAWYPEMRWLTNRYSLIWHDIRLNSPKPSGQQFQRNGIYGKFFDGTGKSIAYQQQVTQTNFYPSGAKTLAGDHSLTVVLFGSLRDPVERHLWMATRKGSAKFDAKSHVKLLSSDAIYGVAAEDDEAGHFLALVRTKERLLALPFTESGPGTKVDLDPAEYDFNLRWDSAKKRFVALYRGKQGEKQVIRIATFGSDGALIGKRAVPNKDKGHISTFALEGPDRLRAIWINADGGKATIEQQQLCLPTSS
jgi:hypothetical protein